MSLYTEKTIRQVANLIALLGIESHCNSCAYHGFLPSSKPSSVDVGYVMHTVHDSRIATEVALHTQAIIFRCLILELLSCTKTERFGTISALIALDVRDSTLPYSCRIL
jgi:hypothetical protein